jgi:uncharacterized protein (DUF433 family)
LTPAGVPPVAQRLSYTTAPPRHVQRMKRRQRNVTRPKTVSSRRVRVSLTRWDSWQWTHARQSPLYGFLPRSQEPPALRGGISTVRFDIDLKIEIKKAVTIFIAMNWRNLIQITPGVRGGKPTLLGTRITPTDILEYVAGGMTEDQILKDFPSLTREHIRAALAYAAERERPST